MDRTLNNSLYEQLLYASVLQIAESKTGDAEERVAQAKALGETFGRRALIVYSRNLPHTAYSSTEKVLHLLVNELWSFIFGNQATDVTAPTHGSISFKDNNLGLLKRLEAPPELKEKKDELLALLKSFLTGIIGGVMLYFRTECEVKIIYQNESLFIHITCEQL